MPKDDHLDPEDKKLFREACQDVEPLKHSHKKTPLKKPLDPSSLPSSKIQHNNSTHIMHEPPLTLHPEQQTDSESTLSFIRDGIQDKLAKQLRQGRLKIEASLDLHGKTSAEAFHLVDDFTTQAQLSYCRCVLIIHGKGYRSKGDGALLKSLVFEWLKNDARVLACHSAQAKHGGTGALYVLIKRNRNDL